MSHRPRSLQVNVAALACIVMLVIIGCGGGDDGNGTSQEPPDDPPSSASTSNPGSGSDPGPDSNSESGSSAATSKPASRATVVAEGNSACGEAKTQMQTELESYLGSSELTPEIVVGMVEDVVIPGFEAQVEGLQALNPPANFEGKIDGVVAGLEATLTEAKADPETFVSNPQSYKASVNKANAAGLTECVRIWETPPWR